MSAAKFASITASLLARKGEARPWTDPGQKNFTWQDRPPEPLAPLPPPQFGTMAAIPAAMPATVQAPPPAALAKDVPEKKCALRMSQREYEQLGILAVKKDRTRQQLLREALAQLIGAMACDYGQCACLKGQSCLPRGCAEA